MIVKHSPLAALLCFAVCAKTANAQTDEKTPPAFTTEKISVVTGKYKLPGKLTLPAGDSKVPGLVLVHGSGPHDADETIGPNRTFKDIAEGLATRGIAVIRYEKRTHKYGASMTPADVTLNFEVIDDAVSAVTLLREHARIDPARVFVLGHSLGGTCAPLIAARDPKIAGIISLSGTPRSLLDLIEEQFEYIFNEDGILSAKEKKTLDDLRESTRLIREGKQDEVKQPILGAPNKYWAELHHTDVITPSKNYSGPILILGGGRDYQVTRTCFDAWMTGLQDKPNVIDKWYPTLNHLYFVGSDPPSPKDYAVAGHFSKRVLDDIAAWILSDGKKLADKKPTTKKTN
ncbi:MAG: alpha/beta fold hydrolase [Planctomycetes bacterium]|nr:alpha/beta fold hydrolase [Planctomycetota bacterium]